MLYTLRRLCLCNILLKIKMRTDSPQYIIEDAIALTKNIIHLFFLFVNTRQRKKRQCFEESKLVNIHKYTADLMSAMYSLYHIALAP